MVKQYQGCGLPLQTKKPASVAVQNQTVLAAIHSASYVTKMNSLLTLIAHSMQ